MSHQITGTGIAAVSAAALDASAPDAATIVGSTWLRALSRDADRARHTSIERRLPLLSPLGLLARPPAAHTERRAHRGPTHSPFGCRIAAAVAAALTSLEAAGLMPLVAVGLAIGYPAYLAGEACTPSGVPA